MRLLKLELKNFQGVSRFTLEPNGEDTSVYGENATGKTTLVSAFNFLLFGKNHDFKTDFQIKTLHPSGEAKHGFDHTVEAVLDLENGGRPLTLTRTYREKWQKKRGAAEPVSSGHETVFHIDGVPMKKQEYEARVAEIADEGAFRLMTSPDYFNIHMKWQDRRALLLEVCGDITDADVIDEEKALKKLPDILGDRSAEDHRKVIAARRKAINDELEKLPVRIDEVSQGLPDVSTGDRKSVEAQLAQVRAEIQEKHTDRARLSEGGEIAEKKRQLAEAKSRLTDIEADARRACYGADDEKRQAIAVLDIKLSEAANEIRIKEAALESNLSSIDRLAKQMDELRANWQEVDAESFEDGMGEPDTTCAACGQDLPAERVQAAREKALAAFNRDKARRLENNVAEGKQRKAEAGELALQNEDLRKGIVELETKREALLAEKAALPEPGGQTDITYPPEHDLVLAAIASLESEIDKLAESDIGALTALDTEIVAMKEQIAEGERQLAEIEQNEKGQERIKELAGQEKILSKEMEQLESELFLMEEFTRAKVRILTGRINSRFQMARFKLFNELINGGIEDTCETLVDGVPYSDLNNGARINVGLDVINTLSEHCGFTAPIFIDNAEAVTELIDTRGQIIRLVVSEPDKELRVETKAVLKEAVNG